MQNRPVSSNVSSGSHVPLCSAASAVIGVNVEPVGPGLSIARFIRGWLEAELVNAW